MKKKIVIFGASGLGKEAYYRFQEDETTEDIAFADNFKTGKLIYKPQGLSSLLYDFIYLAMIAASEVADQLHGMGIDEQKNDQVHYIREGGGKI